MIVGVSPRSDDVPDWARPHLPVAAALATLLAPHGEIAIHDLAADRIVALWNPLSGRRPGDPSLLEELPDVDGAWTSTDRYERILVDGRRLSCVSAVLTDRRGARKGLLCVNLDRSALDQLAAAAGALFAATSPRPPELFARDWRERVAARVHELAGERGRPAAGLDRAGRLEVLTRLEAEGLLEVRNAAELVAAALDVSRATVYALIKEIRS
jgi:predicted transcriptional regulator YheO